MAQWVAFEQVNGPILMHDRVDAAGAAVRWMMAALRTGRMLDPADFLPTWDQTPRGPQAVAEMIATVRRVQRRPGAGGAP